MQTKINFKHFKQPAAILKKKSCVLIWNGGNIKQKGHGISYIWQYVVNVSDASNNLVYPPVLSYMEFYNSTLDHLDLMSEYYTWQNPSSHPGYVTHFLFFDIQKLVELNLCVYSLSSLPSWIFACTCTINL
jgi:hypothetical protein